MLKRNEELTSPIDELNTEENNEFNFTLEEIEDNEEKTPLIELNEMNENAIDDELEAARDELLSMEDAELYMDSENENALIKNKIKADSKPKAVVEDEIKEQLKAIVALWDEQTALKKKIKSDKETLEKKTIAAIEGFNMKDINRFLNLKWIEPITSAIAALPNAIIQSLADAVTSLNEKYAVTYRDIENSIVDSEQELAKLIDQLTGDEYAIAGLSNLFKK